jgi:assimilatory nitrate reductase catalytic subunit
LAAKAGIGAMSTEIAGSAAPVGGRLGPGAVRTTCPYCGVGCGVLAERDGAGARIAGDPAHPANRGRLCSKGSALGETLGLQGRLLHPEIGGARADWNTALDAVARGFRDTIAAHGPDSVALYVSGQLLTEDYYVGNKFAKGFLGTANIDTNSRLCMASSVAGHRRAFGNDVVPGVYSDIEEADLVVIVGSNLAWAHPILYQRLAAAKAARPATRTLRVVVIDPRRTATCDIADLHLALTPGSDVALFAGLLAHLDAAGARDSAYVDRHTDGIDAALHTARATAPDTAAAAALCGVPVRGVAALYDAFARTERVVTIFSQGVNQSSSGTDKVNAIVNCHLLTGRIGRPGMGPFSVTGQPNAMGGREVGALANQLAAHMLFTPEEVDRVARFWRAPAIARRPGLKAIDLFRAVEAGAIKAIWIMATNPAVSLPDAEQARRALAKCPLVVVSDCVRATDTMDLAHVRLPALAWGEKDGTVTNSERVISRQRAFLSAPGEARADWWIVSEVAKRFGFAPHFAYRGPADIFREHAALSAFENDGSRDFDLSGLAAISDAEYARFAPVRWPCPSLGVGQERFFAAGGFFTPDRRARFVPTPARPPAHATTTDYPLRLNTGRVRDQWHTMTRTGLVPRLVEHRASPTVEIHPVDAQRHGLAQAKWARIESGWGSMIAEVSITADVKPGDVFVPMHWNDQFAGNGCVNRVVNPETDAISGQPELKHTPVRVAAWAPAWRALVLSRDRLVPRAEFWSAVPRAGHWRIELAGRTEPAEAWAALRTLAADGAAVEFADAVRADYRAVALDGARGLAAAVFFHASPEAISADRDWLGEHFAAARLAAADCRGILAGRPQAPRPPRGPIVCSCFAIGREAIAAAIGAGAESVAAVGAATHAGTNCGSCRPEIGTLIAAVRQRSAA